MIDGLKPYDKLRSAAQPWLGKVPAHWGEKRAKYFYREVDERSTTGAEELLSVSHKTGVTPRPKHVTMFKAESNAGHKICRPDDLVINTMWAFMAALGVAKQVGVVSPSYGVYRPRFKSILHPEYVDRLLRTEEYKAEYLRRSTGIHASRLRLYPEQFLCIPILCPSPDEQAAIVRFLDHADRRIRQYINTKRQLVALLNEQRLAVIDRAIRGVQDANVQLKQSSVAWLGEVPKSWVSTRLKNVALVQTGITLGKHYGQTPVELRPYLRVANVQAGRLSLETVKTVAVPASEIANSELRAGDVLMTEGGDIDKLGRGCVWQGEISECLHQNHIFAVRPDQRLLLSDFLALLMGSRHGRTYFEITAKQTTNLASTNSTTLGSFPIELPTVTEQQQILNAVSIDTSGLEILAQRATKEIELLRDYRLRLIADVVTGKLNVQNAAAQLADEGGESKAELDELLGDEETEGDADLEAESVEVEA